MTRIRIIVTLKPSLLDAQGRVVTSALHAMGYPEVADVRVGKYMELELADSTDTQGALARAREMCDKLLSNPVIEDYRLELLN